MKFLFIFIIFFALAFCQLTAKKVDRPLESKSAKKKERSAVIQLSTDDLNKANSVRAASGYSWNERQRFMERYLCRGKCIDSFYDGGTSISAMWDEDKSSCLCNITNI